MDLVKSEKGQKQTLTGVSIQPGIPIRQSDQCWSRIYPAVTGQDRVLVQKRFVEASSVLRCLDAEDGASSQPPYVKVDEYKQLYCCSTIRD